MKAAVKTGGHCLVLAGTAATAVFSRYAAAWPAAGYADFIRHYLGLIARPKLWLLAAVLWAVLLLGAWILALVNRQKPAQALAQTAAAAWPALLFPFIPILLFPLDWARVLVLQQILLFLLVLAAARWAGRLELAVKYRPGRRDLVILVAVFLAAYAALAWLRHYSLFSHTYDLAIFDNAYWNTLQGRFWHSDIMGHNYLGEHLNLLLWSFIPLYRLWPSPALLLLLQSFFLVLSAWPLYLLGRQKGLSAWLNLSLLAAYLLYLPLNGVNLGDFHEIALAPFLTLWALYFLEAGRSGWFWLCLGLSFLTKENILLNGVFIGLYLALAKKKWLAGAVLAAFSLVLFQLYLHYLVPLLSGAPYPYFGERYGALGGSAAEIVVHVWSRPQVLLETVWQWRKIMYLGQVFYPLLFLPLLSGWGILLFILPLGSVLLSDFPVVFSNVFNQYGAAYLPFLFYLTVLVLAGIGQPRRRRFLAWFFVLYALAASYQWGRWPGSKGLPDGLYRIEAGSLAGLAEVRALIPPEASVSATRNLGPHLAKRRRLMVFSYLDWAGADFIAVDTRYAKANERWLLTEVLRSPDYGVVYRDDRFVLLKKGAPAAGNEEIRRRFRVD